MTKKKGFFQRLKEEFKASQEDALGDIRRWGREVAHAKSEGRKASVTNVFFTQEDILKRWHVNLVLPLKNVIAEYGDEEADYLIDEALRCVKNKDTHNAMVYLQGVYEKVGDPKIQAVIKKIQKGPSLATKIMMKGLKEKSPPDIVPGLEEETHIAKYDELPPKTRAMFEQLEEAEQPDTETRMLDERKLLDSSREDK